MRELKFRAWDSKREKMFTHPKWVEFNVSATGVLTAKNFNPLGQKGEQGLTVMQYTGLEDKNGVEIYEGDIVHLFGYGSYEVEFPFIDLYEAANEADIGDILGNIYENPELLEE